MKKYLPIALACFASLCISGCGGKKGGKVGEEPAAPKYLVLYYSQTGATEQVAKELQEQLGADIESIEMVEPYENDFKKTIKRCLKEQSEGVTPKIKPIRSKIKEYDAIFLGFPVWFGTYASPVATLFKQIDLSGKKIIPFCTFGSGGLETSAQALKEALPKAEVAPGFGIRNARLSTLTKELNRFLIEQGYKEGEVTPLPPFSAQQPVTDEEKALFEAATGSYQFPLGTPITVGHRTTEEGTDYEFTALANDITTGKESTVIIYVTLGTEEGATPDFTRVVR